MLPPTLDESGDPAYRWLARELRGAIVQQRFPDGVRLPTEAELAHHYGLSRQTVRRAFQDLVSEGLVHRVPGRGTFARSPAGRYLRQLGSVEDLMGLSQDTEMEVLMPLHEHVDIQAAGRLRLDGDRVYTVTYRRLYQDIPLCHTTVHTAPEVGRRLERLTALTEPGAMSEATVLALVDEGLTAPIVEAEQSITAVRATAPLAEVLGCRAGDPLLVTDRVYITVDRRYVELAISHFLPEHYSYRVKLRRSGR